MNLKVEIIQDQKDLINIQSDWNCLYEKCKTENVFLSYEWIHAWCNNRINTGLIRPFIITLRNENNELCGVAPLGLFVKNRYGFRLNVLSFIADVFSDYQDFLVATNHDVIVNKIVETIQFNRGKWDVIELLNFPTDSVSAEILKRNSILGFEKRICGICAKITISGDKTLDSIISKKYKQDIHYQIRRIEKQQQMDYQEVADITLLPGCLEQFYNLHIKRWSITDTPSFFRDLTFQKFFTSMAYDLLSKGMLDFSYMTIGNQMVAAHFGFKTDKVFYYYIPAYDIDYQKYSIGKVFLYKLIQSKLSNPNLNEIDFMRGSEDYKKNWGTTDFEISQLTHTKSNIKGFLTNFFWYYQSHRHFYVFRIWRKIEKLKKYPGNKSNV